MAVRVAVNLGPPMALAAVAVVVREPVAVVVAVPDRHVTLTGAQPPSTSVATQPASTASTIPPIFGHKDRIQPRTTAVSVGVNPCVPMAPAPQWGTETGAGA